MTEEGVERECVELTFFRVMCREHTHPGYLSRVCGAVPSLPICDVMPMQVVIQLISSSPSSLFSFFTSGSCLLSMS